MPDPILSVRDLRKHFGGIAALDDVGFDIRDGELVCIIGPNGAGKSTLLNILCGVLRPDAGTIEFAKHSIRTQAPDYFSKIGIVRKFQVPSVFAGLTVRENIMVANEAVARLASEKLVDEILARLPLRGESEVKAGILSHGKKQWLELGMCLAARPKLLLLDEPTAGMTPEETLLVAQLVKALTAECAVIVIEHDMDFVRDLNGRTCVMHQGRIIRDATFREIAQDEYVADVYLGRD
jgi:branched-chain amino acid transport system ATP-binding protein